jgi:micrococcal nuclease
MRTSVTLTLLLLASATAVPAQIDTIPTLPKEALIDSGPPRPNRETSTCTIRRIIDGDTIECAEVGRVRLIGMDTPELSQEPYGELASQALAGLAPVGSRVELEPDVELRDRYGRFLAYVWVDGLQVNWALVRQGWAVLLTYPPNVQYVDWYTEAQRRAREDGVGLWAVGGFDCLPVDRRRGNCD